MPPDAQDNISREGLLDWFQQRIRTLNNQEGELRTKLAEIEGQRNELRILHEQVKNRII